jgi:hypothetical protein
MSREKDVVFVGIEGNWGFVARSKKARKWCKRYFAMGPSFMAKGEPVYYLSYPRLAEIAKMVMRADKISFRTVEL